MLYAFIVTAGDNHIAPCQCRTDGNATLAEALSGSLESRLEGWVRREDRLRIAVCKVRLGHGKSTLLTPPFQHRGLRTSVLSMVPGKCYCLIQYLAEVSGFVGEPAEEKSGDAVELWQQSRLG